MRALVLLLLLAPVVSAASGWEGTALLAIVTSAGILGAIYGVATGFGINELKVIAKEELYQLIATALMVILLVGGNNIIDALSANLGGLAGAENLQTAAEASITQTLTDGTNGIETYYNKITEMDGTIAVEGSRSLSCNILGIGYGVSACGGYNMLHAPLSMAGGILGFAIGELYAILSLLALSKLFAMNLILPLGILLRTVKITRGAGGFLIALGISLHIMLPMGILLDRMMADTFLDPAMNPNASAFTAGLQTDVAECDPTNVNGAQIVGSEGEKVRGILAGLRADLKGVVFYVLVLGTFGPVLALLMTVAGIRALTSLAGAEVDVSPLGRFL
ncbi:hypothetical protein L0Y65_00685 [Candidatus Micrarchaeota archaeon]|nr:hypothetical protein [Candidatus Micrarchaeota archaeon]